MKTTLQALSEILEGLPPVRLDRLHQGNQKIDKSHDTDNRKNFVEDLNVP
ncbi:hypothetical protein ABZY05_42090 [Streptomyces canus]